MTGKVYAILSIVGLLVTGVAYLHTTFATTTELEDQKKEQKKVRLAVNEVKFIACKLALKQIDKKDEEYKELEDKCLRRLD